MILPGILPFARQLLASALQPGDTAVDGTAGNGHDTLFLAELAGNSGRVYAFDIQAEAIENTRRLLQAKDQLSQVSLFQIGHEQAASVIPPEEFSNVKAAVFNLGYLPGSDKSITTHSESTLAAVKILLDRMPAGGLIVLVIYHGHVEGRQEKQAVEAYAESLDQKKVQVLRYGFINQVNRPPFIIALEKK
ncbi:class I SAM-dependent methyltransferase [Alteribacillus sp. HJP-4]|uniref:tRNA (mnm(5)s(2)U34)-methyltransferase n=1 Tax=Alteribacillus sp. HJP-4 TaxID=2775394 RepID=UPI0035CD39B5